MRLNTKNILLFNDKTFEKNNIDAEKYNLIKHCVDKEIQICGNMIYYGNNSLYKKSLELINTINNCKYIQKDGAISIYSTQHRLITLDNVLQKQIFINNFVFSNNDNLIKFLTYCNISVTDIRKLINDIQKVKNNNIAILEINNDEFNIDGLCKIYNCKYPTLIINKVLELYYKNPELFDELEKKDNMHTFTLKKR